MYPPMIIRDEITNVLKKEIDLCDEYLERTHIASNAVPNVQRKKDEAAAQLESIYKIPDDLLDEIGPDIKSKHNKEKEKLEKSIPKLPQINWKAFRVGLVSNSTSSSSDIVSSILGGVRPQPILYDYFRPLTNLVKNEDRKSIIVNSFSKLSPALGDYISKAQETSISARGGVAPIDLACQHIRSCIDKIWGEIVDYARNECDSLPGIRYQLKKESNHRSISECLGRKNNNPDDIESLLKSICSLYNELSPSSKDPFINDINYFVEVYTRWNLHFYNLAHALDLAS